MENRQTPRKAILTIFLLIAALGVTFALGYSAGEYSERSPSTMTATGDPPGAHADPASVAAFFKAWDDPAARGAIGPDTPKEVVLAEIVRLVLHDEPGEAIGGFNAYMNKAALSFSEEEIDEVGRLLASENPKERQQGFLLISASDLEAALLISTVLTDPRTAVAPSATSSFRKTEPVPPPLEEPESEETSPAQP